MADLSNLNVAIAAIVKASGASFETVVENETAKILEACVKATPAAKVANIRARIENQEFGFYDTREFTPKRPSKAPVSKNGYKRYYLLNRYPAALWKIIAAQRKADLQSRVRARGLTKQSWFMLAQAFGLVLNVPGYVANALPRNGKSHPENVVAQKIRENGRVIFRGTNAMPILKWVGGRRILNRAIAGRVKFFETNLRKGVFDDIEQIAAKYPGIKTR